VGIYPRSQNSKMIVKAWFTTLNFAPESWNMPKKTKFFILPLILLLAACSGAENKSESTPENSAPAVPPPANIGYTVVNIYPHDTSAFTQGLVYRNNQLYEGTGLYNESSLRRVDLKSGNVQKETDLDTSLFGEGITILHDTIYQLTWKEHVAIAYSLKDFKELKRFNWSNEGWGITNNGTDLIISDGSDKIYFVRPSDFKLLRVLSVYDNLGPMDALNELEWINGSIYANRWERDYIVKIDPESGRIIGRMEFKDALQTYAHYSPAEQARVQEDGAFLNGIAWDSTSQRLFVTGKLWPKLLEVKLNN